MVLKESDLNNNNLTHRNVDKTKANKDSQGEAVYHQLTLFQRSGLQKFLGEYIVPLLLMTAIPLLTLTIWYTCKYHGGSFVNLASSRIHDFNSLKTLLIDITINQWTGSFFALYVIIGYFAWAIFWTLVLPGETYCAPVTDKGNVPKYVDNGFKFFVVTLVSFVLLSATLEYYGYSVTSICDRYGEFVLTINVFALLFCLFLYFKGKYFPSSSDNGTSGNPIFDYYWGVELYPRIGKLDIKMLTNCRWGMMIWTLVVILFWMKSLKVHGFVDGHFVTMILIVSYLAKFFWWESGYMKTIDIVVDRAGYYICYGCLSFVPLFYALPSIYLSFSPVHLGWPLASFIAAAGFLSLYVNYDADNQRYIARNANGNCTIWGKKAKIVNAKYTLLNGKQSENILLASGYWGLSRHFHYVPELTLAFSWCATGLFLNIMPFLYFIFLSILLFHRSLRDDAKCSNKYGKYWDQYKRLVPYKIVPFIY